MTGVGNGDYLANYGTGNVLMAQAGTEVIADWTTVNGAGSTYLTGTGATTIYGGVGGNDTVGFGSGLTDIYFHHGSAMNIGNTFYQLQAGGVDILNNFIVGLDVFNLSMGPTHETVSSIVAFGAGSLVTLNDGTRIEFLNAPVTTRAFV